LLEEDSMTTTAAATEPTTAAPKPPRSSSTTLKGDGGTLRVLIVFNKKGGAKTFVLHTTKGADGKNVNQRGATTEHPTVAAARAAADKLVEQAVKLGWQRSERKAGFTARPDAFTAAALPVPGKKVTSKKR
jgi:hypothetical protein